jgi:hypothetical protein
LTFAERLEAIGERRAHGEFESEYFGLRAAARMCSMLAI